MIESRCEASSKSKSAVWYRAADFLWDIVDYESFVIIEILVNFAFRFDVLLL